MNQKYKQIELNLTYSVNKTDTTKYKGHQYNLTANISH